MQEGDSLLIETYFSVPMKENPIPQISFQSSDTNQVPNLALTNLNKVSDTLYTYNYVVPSGFATMMAGVSGGYDITNSLQQSETISFKQFKINSSTSSCLFVVTPSRPAAKTSSL